MMTPSGHLDGAERIAAERRRQTTDEGYTAEHDAGHADDLAEAAQAYAFNVALGLRYGFGDAQDPDEPTSWPWAMEFWKPTGDPIRDLEKAGALIAAAIDSLLVNPPAEVDDAERGRQLASQREDLIARGANPAELLVPLHPSNALPHPHVTGSIHIHRLAIGYLVEVRRGGLPLTPTPPAGRWRLTLSGARRLAEKLAQEGLNS